MYECQSCGHRFETPKEHNEWHEAGDARFPEIVLGCPRCGGGYIELPEAAPKEDADEKDSDEAETVTLEIARDFSDDEIPVLAYGISLMLESLTTSQLINIIAEIIRKRTENEELLPADMLVSILARFTSYFDEEEELEKEAKA